MHISPILCELHIYTLQLWIVLNRKLRSSSDPRKQLAVHYTRNGVLHYIFFSNLNGIIKITVEYAANSKLGPRW